MIILGILWRYILKQTKNQNSYECKLNYFVCTSLCATKQSYKYIDKVYNSNKKKYDNYSKECAYYNLANSRLLEEELYYKKTLGIIYKTKYSLSRGVAWELCSYYNFSPK